ncbi:MAG: tandem-95 repeat protein, partial [Gammaproteobacteria bacterium]|nr:tandem-95 repeat protein [Gammaproteobacteria bacterium]
VQVSDVDVGAGVMTVSLTLGNQQTVANGSLNLANSTGLVFAAGSSATGSTITFDGSLTDINAALATLTYSANPNFNGTERLNVVVSDGGNSGVGGVLSDARGLDIIVTAVNDAPVLTVPGAQVVNEDTDLPISGISINDVDAGNGRVAVTLSAGSGVLSLTPNAGLIFTAGSGNQDSSMIFNGTLSDVNAALASVVFYRPNLNFNGTDTISITVDDQGNSGVVSAAGTTDSASIAVTINAVNDAPVLTLPAAQTVAEDGVLALNNISVADVDAGTGLLTVSLTLGDAQNPANGTLNLAGSANLNFAIGSSASGSSMTFSGTVADINNALGTLTYTGNLNFNGSERLNITVNDGGSSGSGGPLSDSGSVAIEVTPVNDAPLLNVPGILAVNEDISLSVSGVSISDVDAGTTPLTVTLSANNGTLSLTQVNNITFTTGSSASGASITFSGQLADINAALATLSYRGNANFFGADSIRVAVDDQGGGGGAALTDSRLIAVDVSPINDGPNISLSVSVLSYQEGDLPLLLDANLTVVDPDSTNLQSATVTLANVQQGDLLAFTSSANVSGNYNAASGVLTLSADPVLGATVADFQAALQSVTYVNTLTTVPAGLRPVTFSATDGADSGLSPTLTLSVNSGFTAVPTTPGTVTPADPRPPLNGIQTPTGGLTPIPSSNIDLLGGVNLPAGQTNVPQGAQLLSPDSNQAPVSNSSGFQSLSLQNVRAGRDAFPDECSLDEIFKRVDMGCRFANVEKGFEDTQYLSVASGIKAGWQYPMADEKQGLLDQLAGGEGEALGLNQQPGDFSDAYLSAPSAVKQTGQPLPESSQPQQIKESTSGDAAVDNAAELFAVEPAASAVNIQPLTPLSGAGDLPPSDASFEIDDSQEEGELLLEDEPLPADAELSPDLDANVQILGRAVNLLGRGSRA